MTAVLFHQDYETALKLAAGALDLLEGDHPHWRLIALWNMAESQERTRNIAEAIATYREAARTGRALGNLIFDSVIEASLAAALDHHGERQAAVAVCERAISRYTDEGGRASPLAAIIFSRLGVLYHEANQLELARQHLDKGLSLSQQIGLAAPLIASYSLSVATLYAAGETETALEVLQKTVELAGQTNLADVDWLLAWEASRPNCSDRAACGPSWSSTRDSPSSPTIPCSVGPWRRGASPRRATARSR